MNKRLASYEANRRDFQLRTHLENHRIGAAKDQADQLRTVLVRGASDLRVASLTVQGCWKLVDQVLVRVHRENVQAQVDDAFVNASLGERVMCSSSLV